MLRLFQEINISRRDDPNQLSPHLPVVRDGNPTESVTSFCLKHISHAIVGAQHHGVCDEPLLVFLKRSRCRSQAQQRCQAEQKLDTCLVAAAAAHKGPQSPKLGTCPQRGSQTSTKAHPSSVRIPKSSQAPFCPETTGNAAALGRPAVPRSQAVCGQRLMQQRLAQAAAAEPAALLNHRRTLTVSSRCSFPDPNPTVPPPKSTCLLPLPQPLTFTFRTSLAWNSGVQLWCMNPIPPVS